MLFTYKSNPETPTDLYACLNNCQKKEHNSSMTCHIACQTLPIYINEHDVISSLGTMLSVLFIGFEILTLRVT